MQAAISMPAAHPPDAGEAARQGNRLGKVRRPRGCTANGRSSRDPSSRLDSNKPAGLRGKQVRWAALLRRNSRARPRLTTVAYDGAARRRHSLRDRDDASLERRGIVCTCGLQPAAGSRSPQRSRERRAGLLAGRTGPGSAGDRARKSSCHKPHRVPTPAAPGSAIPRGKPGLNRPALRLLLPCLKFARIPGLPGRLREGPPAFDRGASGLVLWHTGVVARGWESKSVESQIESADARPEKTTSLPLSAGERERQRELHSRKLARVRVQHDLAVATHPGHIASLEAALRHLDEKIKGLG